MAANSAGAGVTADMIETTNALPATQPEATRLSENEWVGIVSDLAAQLGAWDDEELQNQPIADDDSVVLDSALGLCVATYVTACYGQEFGDLSKIPPAQWRSARGVAAIIRHAIDAEGE
ncbi:MAG: hypothetical protein JWN70_6254 [Planctomycetaceae bacterium]|nr:hypothetical protein [Planctomycetaceae bacterium]